jgi:hypothetical protein
MQAELISLSDSSEEENKGHILKKRILEKLDMIITSANLEQRSCRTYRAK